jgi:hypothetical protein
MAKHRRAAPVSAAALAQALEMRGTEKSNKRRSVSWLDFV